LRHAGFSRTSSRHDRHERADTGADGVLFVGGWRNSLLKINVHGMDGGRSTRAGKAATRYPTMAARGAGLSSAHTG
jgi:hypothetical protein